MRRRNMGRKMHRSERPITRRINAYSSPSNDARNVREKEKTEIMKKERVKEERQGRFRPYVT
jgi:hypothetical protein